jgi:serine/threonine-protein kinase RsbW
MASDTGPFDILDQVYPSTLESVDVVEADILKAATEAGFAEDEQRGIGMAVRERMVNAVVHGNRYNKNKHIHVNVSKSASGFTVRITESGRRVLKDPPYREDE